MGDTRTRAAGNATLRGPDAKRFAFFMPGPPRQLLKIFTCYLWGTHASRTKRTASEPAAPAELRFRTRLHLSRANPFSASFPPTTVPFPVSPLPSPSLSLLSPSSSAPPRSYLRHPPATSREFCKTFHASLAASVSYPPTKQRILVWIEFLMEPTPPGSRPIHPPFLVSFVRDARRCSTMLDASSGASVYTAASTRAPLYRFLRARDNCSHEMRRMHMREGHGNGGDITHRAREIAVGKPRRLLFHVRRRSTFALRATPRVTASSSHTTRALRRATPDDIGASQFCFWYAANCNSQTADIAISLCQYTRRVYYPNVRVYAACASADEDFINIAARIFRGFFIRLYVKSANVM